MRENIIAVVVTAAVGLVIIFMAVSSRLTKPQEIAQVGDDAPDGIHITEWKVSFEADPTAESFGVDLLFIHHGIAVYRFFDQEKPVYFTSSVDMDWSEIGGMASSATIVSEE